MTYMTVTECMRANGDRHQANGWRYLEQGKTSFARGSFTKAQRNYERASMLDVPDWLAAIVVLPPIIDPRWFDGTSI